MPALDRRPEANGKFLQAERGARPTEQLPCGYEVDFFLPSLGVMIEVDGVRYLSVCALVRACALTCTGMHDYEVCVSSARAD